MDENRIVEAFWEAMDTNDFYAAAQLLHDDYVLEWPQSGESIHGRDNFAALNTAYPRQGPGISRSINSCRKITRW